MWINTNKGWFVIRQLTLVKASMVGFNRVHYNTDYF
jgi:hypothetical protein